MRLQLKKLFRAEARDQVRPPNGFAVKLQTQTDQVQAPDLHVRRDHSVTAALALR